MSTQQLPLKTKEQLINAARHAGSTSSTFAGAFRYLRTHPIRTRHGNFFGGWNHGVKPGPSERRTTRATWELQAHRVRWESRQERLAREIMAAGRYIKRRKTPVALLDRQQYEVLAASFGLPTIPEAEAWASELTAPLLASAAAALEASWPYKRSESKWAGGEHSVRVVIGEHPGASCETSRVWSDNSKWSGTNSAATIVTDLRTVMEFPTLMTRDGLALCKATGIAPREYQITWIEQSTGVSLKTVDGFLIRGYHVKTSTLDQARKKAHTARQNALSSTLNARQMKLQKRAGFAALRSVYVAVEDSIAAGNCAPTTNQFAAQVWKQIGASGPCAVRADVVMTARDDSYTRRALGVAMSRGVAHA
jgi:hypothetical protein